MTPDDRARLLAEIDRLTTSLCTTREHLAVERAKREAAERRLAERRAEVVDTLHAVVRGMR